MKIRILLLFLLTWFVESQSQTLHIISDSSWRGRNTFPGIGWLMPGYVDASWLHTTAPNPENVIPVVPGSLSMWQRPNRDTAYMRKTFTIPVGDSYSGSLVINSDNAFYIFFNGVLAGSGTDWFSGPFTFSISPALTGCSENVIGIVTINYGGPFGCSLVSDINVVNPLYSPVALSPASIDCNGFMSRWNSVSTATGYYLDVSTDSLFGTFLAGYNNRSMGTDTSQYVSGLTTGVTYYYRVRCTRGVLTSCNSNVISVRTVSMAPLTRNLFICDNDSVYLQAAWRDTSGTYRDTFSLASGCDSIVISNLTVYPTYHNSLTRFICDHDSSFINGAWRYVAGVYTENNRSVHSCDSIVDITLVIRPTNYSRTITICNGDQIYLGGMWRTVGGLYTDTYRGYLGCDSILTTTLIVNNISASTRLASICNGDSYLAGGTLQTTGGSYYDTLVNYLGCDSILRTNLTVLATSSFARSIDICSGDSFFTGGANRAISGVYYDTLSNYLSCDSLLRTTLNVLPVSTFTINFTICNGDSILAGGVERKTSGSYYDTLVNIAGCDSVLRTNLTVRAPITGNLNVSICSGDSVLAGGIFRFNSGIYYDTMTSYTGCDSLFSTNLTVNVPVTSIRNINICYGSSYFVGGSLQSTSGIYYDTLVNINGCDSTLRTNLNIYPLVDTVSDSVSVCMGQFFNGQIYTADTFFIHHLLNVNGCDSIFFETLTVFDNPNVDAGADKIMGLGEVATLIASGASSYVWSNGEFASTIKVSPLMNTTYIVVGEDSNGCKDDDSITVFIQEPIIKLLVPTAFSPNGDGVNDLFRILNYYDFNLTGFNIYNRWGQLVYDGSLNSMTGWDGQYKNREQPLGVYSYYITGRIKRNNKVLSESGNFTLMR